MPKGIFYGDQRLANLVNFEVSIRSFFKRKAWNLRPLLMNSNKISIFVSKLDKLDCIHANHISDIEGVKIYEFEDGAHSIVKLLRDEGKLPAIMSGTYA